MHEPKNENETIKQYALHICCNLQQTTVSLRSCAFACMIWYVRTLSTNYLMQMTNELDPSMLAWHRDELNSSAMSDAMKLSCWGLGGERRILQNVAALLNI